MPSANGESVDKPKRSAKNSKSRSPSKPRRSTESTHPTTAMPAVGKRIRVYRNGDPFHKGINVVLNMRHAHDINSFLDAISERIGLVSGVKRLYTMNGNQVKSTNALENNKEYVASSGGFMPLNYGHAYKQQQAAFLPKKEESSFSLASSKRSLPTRMSRSSTELRSTSRDLSVRSMNGNGSHKVVTDSNHAQPTTKTTTKRAKSLTTRKKTVEHKPNQINNKLEVKVEKPKKKRIKNSPTSPKTLDATHQNGKSKSPPKRKVVKKKKSAEKKTVTKQDTLVAEEDDHRPAIIVHEQQPPRESPEHRPSSRSESRFSSASQSNRPPSRRGSRASTQRRTETAESRKSSHRESGAEHTDRTDHTNESHHHRDEERRPSESEHHTDHDDGHQTDNSRPASHQSTRPAAHSPQKGPGSEKEDLHSGGHHSDRESEKQSPRPNKEHHHHSGSEAESHHAHSEGKHETDESTNDESEDERQNREENKSKHNVPLEAL